MPVQRCCGRAASIPGRAESPDAFLATLRSVPRRRPTPTRAFPARRGVARPRRARPSRACAALAHARCRLPRLPRPASLRAPGSRGRRALGVVPAARARTMPPPAAPPAPPRSRPSPGGGPRPSTTARRRRRAPAPGAAGHDGRWNLAAATRAAFPGFPTPRPRGKPSAEAIRVAEPHHETPRLRPRLLRPPSSAPASSAPAPSSLGARLPPSPRRFHRRLAAHVGVPRDGPERPPALRDPPGDRVRGRALRHRGQARGRAHGRRRGVDRGERPAVRPRAGGRGGGRAAAAEADAQARQTDGGAAALRQDEARAGNPRGGVRGEASDQEVQGAAVRRRER